MASQDLTVSPNKKKTIPRILVRPTTRKVSENNSNGLSKKDFDPLTKSPSQEANAFMSKSLLMDDPRSPTEKTKIIEGQSPYQVETAQDFLY